MGVCLGGITLYLRARCPDQYAIIGRIIYEDIAERPDVDRDGRGDHAGNPLRS
jgi:hypothetical protein